VNGTWSKNLSGTFLGSLFEEESGGMKKGCGSGRDEEGMIGKREADFLSYVYNTAPPIISAMRKRERILHFLRFILFEMKV